MATFAYVSASWRRCSDQYHIDPEGAQPPRILTRRELEDFRGPAQDLIDIGRGELDWLYSLVRASGYVVLLCDANGVVIDHRGNEAEADRFKYWGIWLGGVWSEETEGTNGIGTCISERRPVVVHRDQHYRMRHLPLSCSAAPIFGPDCGLVGVLDVSSMDPGKSERARALSLPITARAARAIEARLFRKGFCRRWVIALSSEGFGGPVTIAVDDHQQIVGADRAARRALNLDDQLIGSGDSLWTHFKRDVSFFRGDVGEDIPTQLRRRSDGSKWRGIVTPPASQSRGEAEAFVLHIRPRLSVLSDLRPPVRVRRFRGGLSRSALQQVRAYIDARLHEKIRLEALCAVAGLSLSYFAHSFKEAVGFAPHYYVLQRRVERGRDMLLTTDLPLAEIALSVGFSDHSHFARHFKRRFGVTPSSLRRNRAGAPKRSQPD